MGRREERQSSLWILPSISGWLWRPFLIVWITCFGLAVLGGFLYARDDVHLTPATEYSFGFMAKSPFATGDPSAASEVWIVLSEEAKIGGLRSGDRIVSMNGQQLRSGERPIDTTWIALGRPDAVNVEVLAADGRRKVHRLTYDPSHADEGIRDAGISYSTWRSLRAVALLLIGTAIPLFLAGLLLAKRWREPLAPWASLTFILQAITLGGAERASALRDALPPNFWLLLDLFSTLALLLTLTFFPDGRITKRWMWAVVAFDFAFALHLLFPIPLNVENLIVAFAFIPAVIVMISKYRDMPIGDGRQQIQWVIFSLFTATVFYFVGTALQSIIFHTELPGRFVVFDLASAFAFETYVLLTYVGITVGLMRYRLYDADATISQSIVLGTLTLSLLAIFAASEKFIELLGEHYLGDRLGALAGAIGAASAAVMIVPLHHRVTRWTEKRFRSGLAKLRHGLPLLVGDMRETASPQELAGAALLRVKAGVRARHGAVVAYGELIDVRDTDEGAVRDWIIARRISDRSDRSVRSDVDDDLFPVQVPLQADGQGFVGWLLLGPRPDGSLYGRGDREALSEIADPLARALAIAIDRGRREVARETRDAFIDRELQALRKFMRDQLRLSRSPRVP